MFSSRPLGDQTKYIAEAGAQQQKSGAGCQPIVRTGQPFSNTDGGGLMTPRYGYPKTQSTVQEYDLQTFLVTVFVGKLF